MNPDLFDLEYWAAAHAPESEKATRYLHASNRRAALEAAWRAAGSPNIEESRS
jgi:hypothetical protein